MTSPLEREILTHFWVTTEPFPRGDSPACAEAITTFVNMGLLYWEDGRVLGNYEALDVYMEALDKVPLPVQKWVVPA